MAGVCLSIPWLSQGQQQKEAGSRIPEVSRGGLDEHQEHRGVTVHVESCAPPQPIPELPPCWAQSLGMPWQPCPAAGRASGPNPGLPGWALLRDTDLQGPRNVGIVAFPHCWEIWSGQGKTRCQKCALSSPWGSCSASTRDRDSSLGNPSGMTAP